MGQLTICDLHLKTLGIMLDENSRWDVPIQPSLDLKKFSFKSVAFVMGKSYIAAKVNSISSESREDFMRWQSLIDLSETAFSMERLLKRGWFITATLQSFGSFIP